MEGENNDRPKLGDFGVSKLMDSRGYVVETSNISNNWQNASQCVGSDWRMGNRRGHMVLSVTEL